MKEFMNASDAIKLVNEANKKQMEEDIPNFVNSQIVDKFNETILAAAKNGFNSVKFEYRINVADIHGSFVVKILQYIRAELRNRGFSVVSAKYNGCYRDYEIGIVVSWK